MCAAQPGGRSAANLCLDQNVTIRNRDLLTAMLANPLAYSATRERENEHLARNPVRLEGVSQINKRQSRADMLDDGIRIS